MLKGLNYKLVDTLFDQGLNDNKSLDLQDSTYYVITKTPSSSKAKKVFKKFFNKIKKKLSKRFSGAKGFKRPHEPVIVLKSIGLINSKLIECKVRISYCYRRLSKKQQAQLKTAAITLLFSIAVSITPLPAGISGFLLANRRQCNYILAYALSPEEEKRRKEGFLFLFLIRGSSTLFEKTFVETGCVFNSFGSQICFLGLRDAMETYVFFSRKLMSFFIPESARDLCECQINKLAEHSFPLAITRGFHAPLKYHLASRKPFKEEKLRWRHALEVINHHAYDFNNGEDFIERGLIWGGEEGFYTSDYLYSDAANPYKFSNHKKIADLLIKRMDGTHVVLNYGGINVDQLLEEVVPLIWQGARHFVRPIKMIEPPAP